MAGRVLDQRAETLREAACAGDTDTVQELISSGVDPNDQNHMNGWTAVHWAAKRGHGGVLRVLLENGGNLQTVNSKNETPVDVAHPAVLPILRAAGVTELPSSDEAPKQDGFTPNYLANPDFFYLKSTPGAGRHADAQKLASLKRKQEGANFQRAARPAWRLCHIDGLPLVPGCRESSGVSIRRPAWIGSGELHTNPLSNNSLKPVFIIDMVAQQTAAASLPQANHAPAIAAPTLTPASVPQPVRDSHPRLHLDRCWEPLRFSACS
ncbi:uncharacterized protein MONBRDRAFT_35631 [Monosiga brevicollis MX1]|uniref:Uncharacterized protein n=1 Tax=Monosiga brevicollis TaxID=81824 RepID=A9UQE2_MONBE|nr:uncharacterized protein MONBRDRAFT_35631 [Monosiga brevicollis MX1]EDQ92583.1 predicted protein [Monosiga brevicollis MX1]|eukprot:XP_001742345.1 hypothetical protein [Monosiga brevicollis MX1]